MLDETYTHENVLAVSFSEHSNAYEAINRLKELDAQGKVGLRGAAVVIRQEDGKVVTKEEAGEASWEGAAGGGLIGLLVGVLGGPLGVLVGGVTGVLVGSLFDDDDDEMTESALADISKSIGVGTPALVADVAEESPTAIDAVMANLGGTVVRRSAVDVRAEIAAAEEAQREAKKAARKELREAREKKHKDEVDAKLDALKAKLGRHKATEPAHKQKEPAATS
jgi:uncharacterized membrane protein